MNGIKYRKVEELVDSGVEWLGEIPREWEVKKLKYIADIKTGNKDTQDRIENGKYPFFVRSDTIERINSFSYDGEAILTAGDGDIGKIFHYVRGKFNYHQRVYKFSSFKGIDGKFLYYYLQIYLQRKVIALSAKSTVDSLRIPMLLNFECVLCKNYEQKKVANFLDYKTSQFDSIINKKEQLILKLEEAKKSLISEVVTGKVRIVDGKLIKRDPSEMKDSGAEWLGKVSKDWSIKPLKFCTKESLKYGANEAAELNDKKLPRYIRITDFDNEGVLCEDTFKSLDLEVARPFLLNEGDVLFARSGATVGKTFIFKNYSLGLACFAGYLIKATCNTNILLPEFLFYFTKSGNYYNWKNQIFIPATIQNIGADKYKNLVIPIPKIEVQKEFSHFLDTKTSQLDSIIKKQKQLVDKLKQAKQSLISEAVTGKIDLRDWEIIDPEEAV